MSLATVSWGRRRLGKLPPKTDPRTLVFESYLPARLPPAPPQADRCSRVARWPMYGNDRLGDCTCAAAAHMVQSWTAYAGVETVLAWRAVEAAYFDVAGGKDDGAACLDVLKHWRTIGIGGDRIGAFARLRAAEIERVKQSVELFGSCYLGLALPDFAVRTRKRWDVPASGAIGSARPQERNGHCVPAVGYDAQRVYVVTWGRVKAMTWSFYRAYVDEAYAVLDRDWIEKDRKAPSGFDVRSLLRDLSALH